MIDATNVDEVAYDVAEEIGQTTCDGNVPVDVIERVLRRWVDADDGRTDART